jgi:DNA-binding transcriptional LysR family regulator
VAVVEREPLVVVLPEGHSEASGERANLAALTDEVLIAVARTRVPGLFEHAMAAWSAVEGDPARTREAGTPTTVMALVQAGFGVAVMPQALAVEASEKLSVRPLRQHRPAVETAIVWHPSNRSPVMARFLRIALSTPEPDVLGPERARSSRPVPERRWPGLQG